MGESELEPDAACTVFEPLMISGRTARNMQSTDNNKEYFDGFSTVHHGVE
jgi:hypothetical protein